MNQYNDIKLERSLLRAIIHVSGFVKECYESENIGSGLFSSSANVTIYEALINYYKSHNGIPSQNIFDRYIIRYLNKNQLLTKKEQIEKFRIINDRLFSRPTTNKEKNSLRDMVEHLVTLKKARSIQNAIIQTVDHLEDDEIEEAEKTIIDFKVNLMAESNTVDEGDYVDDWIERVRLIQKKRKYPELFQAIPTGISGWNPINPFKDNQPTSLDIFLHGGFYKEELAIVIGDSGAGKSFSLMELAYTASLANKNVAYFTIEMSKWKAQTRMDSRISGVPYGQFRTAKITGKEFKRWKNKVDRYKEDIESNKKGWIHVVGFPRGCTVSSIELKAMEIEQVRGQPVEFIVIDYLNDLRPIGTYMSNKSWDAQGELSWNLKQLARTWNRNNGVPVVTANQGKTSSALSQFKTSQEGLVIFKKMHWSDAAFSPLPSHHAAVILGLLNSKYDENNVGNMLNYQIIKNRDGETSLGIVTFPRPSLCRLNSKKMYGRAKKRYKLYKKQDEDEEIENFNVN